MNTSNLHLSSHDEEDHIFAFNSLHVLLGEESKGVWYAICREIDYAASGSSIDDVKNRFERGFVRTIQLH